MFGATLAVSLLVSGTALAQVYEFTGATDGWSAGACGALSNTTGSSAQLTVTCLAPSILSPTLSLDAAANRVLTVAVSSDVTQTVDLRFTAAGVEHRVRRAFTIEGHTLTRAHRVNLAAIAAWSGTVTRVVLELPDADKGVLQFDRIAFDGVPWRRGFSFERAGDLEGWRGSDTISGLTVSGGAISGTANLISSTKPRLEAPAWFLVESRDARTLSMRYKATSPNPTQSLRVWWGTESAPTLNVSRSTAVAITADGTWRTVHLELYAHAKWRDRVVAFWVQPFDTAENGATFAFDDIAFEHAIDVTTPASAAGFTATGIDGLRVSDGALRGVITAASTASITIPTVASAGLYNRLVVAGTFDAGLPCTFAAAFRVSGGAFTTLGATPNCEGQRFVAVLDVGSNGAWTGKIDALRIDLPGSASGRRSFALDRISLQHGAASPELASVTVSSPLTVGESVVVRAVVENRGTEALTGAKVVIGGTPEVLPTLAPFTSATVTRTLGTQTSCGATDYASITVTGQFTGSPGAWTQSISVSPRWLDAAPSLPSAVPPAGAAATSQVLDRVVLLENDRVRFVLLQDPCLGGYGRLQLYGALGGAWVKVADKVGLGRVVVEEAGVVTALELTAITPTPLGTVGNTSAVEGDASITTELGTEWSFGWTFTLATGQTSVHAKLVARPSKASGLRVLAMGLDLPGSGDALLGGVDFTSGEPSGGSRAIVGEDATRRTVDPALVTLPAMAVQGALTAGVAWLPGQTWLTGKIGVAPSFLSAVGGPHRFEVLVPPPPQGVTNGGTVAPATTPVGAAQDVAVEARFFVRSEPLAEAALKGFWEAFGTPTAVAPDSNTALLRVRTALASAYVSGSGWVTRTGAVPRAFGDVAVAAALIADQASDPTLSAHVGAASALPASADWVLGSDHPGLEAPWRLGGFDSLVPAWAAIQGALAASPGLLDGTDGTAGLALRTARLARFARLTGYAAAETLAKQRLGELLAAKRPRGGLLADGVPALAPDVAALSDAVIAHVEGFLLTADEAHRTRAREHVYSAMTFVSPSDAPGVSSGRGAYAVVSALGGRQWTDSLFGKTSAVQGGRLALALLAFSRVDNTQNWTSFANELRNSVYRRLNPIDGSPAAGWVAESWDLRADVAAGVDVLPALAARVTAEGQGALVSSVDVSTLAGLSVRLAVGGTIGSPKFNAVTYAVSAQITPPTPTRPFFVSAGNLPAAPDFVRAGGATLNATSDLDTAASGWQYFADLQLVAIKVAPSAASVLVELGYPIPDKDKDGYPANVDCDDALGSIHPGALETCNARDDDCDGDTDDPDATGMQRCGIGGCDHEEPKCLLGVQVPCDALAGKADESCNGIDDDCDSFTDEQVGLIACGVGACKHFIDACGGCDPFKGKDDESCNGIDDDCDGETDETPGTVLCGVGACERLISICATCEPDVGAMEEVCNLADDDCDGQTDEDLPTVPCGTGACQHQIPQCGSCDPRAGQKPETCNLVDDDCDGETDEGTPTITCGEGVCARPIPACQECAPLTGSSLEVCNGQDDDCNGATDDAAGVKPCGTGACYREIPKCEACDGSLGKSDEVCDGFDNDCDGQTDELTGQAICGLGNCAHPVNGCSECDPGEGAVAETCNNQDDDCDGATDEPDDLGVFSCGHGVCERELPLCSAGAATSCDATLGAGSELCNGQDDDCDGVTDEDVVEWTCGTGACAQVIAGCDDPSVCKPLAGAKPETCNGKDDDCDGETDEELGYITCGELIGCPQALPKCIGGAPVQCNPNGLAPEICDGADNDCDGITDENQPVVSCGVGICSKTLPGCIGGVPTHCDPLEGAGSEDCNFVDDDCDGQTDESSPELSCGEGICAVTISGCLNGFPKPCVPNDIGKPDVCNLLDDDCDGETDEGQGSITCGTGECRREVNLCVDGVTQSCDEQTGQAPELCNELDDDCDGETDEELGTVPCGLGECARELAACIEGAPPACDAFAGLTPEICDGKDNDCDGEPDDSLGDLNCPKPEGVVKIPACIGGVPSTCDTELPTDGTDATDATDGADGADGAVGPRGAPAGDGCGTGGRGHPGLLLVALLCLAPRRRRAC